MKFKPQCKTEADLHEQWARVLRMCEGTEARPKDGWKVNSELIHKYPEFSGDARLYEFSVGIVEGKHVFIGDTLYRKQYRHTVVGVEPDGAIRCEYFDGQIDSHNPGQLSWNPPKQEPIIPEGFTPWHGGEWTGHPEDELEYILRDGFRGKREACSLHFKHKGEKGVLHLSSYDIIAYKITKKYQPETVMVELPYKTADYYSQYANDLGASCMTDRELLELAAKAGGVIGEYKEYSICKGIDQSGEVPNPYISTYPTQYNNTTFFAVKCWNPLTDDGDALRLAVRLELDINCYPKSGEVAAVQHRQNIGVYSRSIERISNDAYAATRRAIVRAAAEIGKGME